MPNVVAIVIADRKTSRLGLPSRIDQTLDGMTVLQRTVRRVEKIKSVKQIIVLHRADQDVSDLVQQNKKQLVFHADENGLTDKFMPMRQAARKWAMVNWRGGLGGATCYDELLPIQPIHDAAVANQADAVILVGGDWPLVDPELCEGTLGIHLEHPDNLQMTFNQAPPGLSGIVVATDLLKQMTDNDGASFGNMLAYVPAHPQADPIGRDICYAIPPAVRSVAQRFIYDNRRSIAMMNALDINWNEATASEIVQAMHVPISTPQQVSIELTPRRVCKGPLMPQHYVDFDRPDMAMSTLERILGTLPDEALITFGGLGDAMLHAQWADAVQLAHDAGAFGICIQTDLQDEPSEVEKLLGLPIDIVSVWINADTAATYEKLCAPIDETYNFNRITDNLQWLLNERNRHWQLPDANDYPGNHPGVPWLVPHLTKVADNLKDMETFFDRWMHYTQHAVILGSPSGCGLMPELGPVRMAPPTRIGCRQLPRRITIHSDGTVAQCDQDWQGKAPLGNLAGGNVSLPQVWEDKGKALCASHATLDIDTLELCNHCHEWHRP